MRNKREDNRNSQGVILRALAELYINQGRFDEAFEACKESLALRESISGTEGIRGVAFCLETLARLHSGLHDWLHAEIPMMSAMRIYEQIGDSHRANSLTYIHASMLIGRKGKYVAEADTFAAYEQVQKYLDYYRGTPFRSEQAAGKRLLGKIHAAASRYDDSVNVLEESVAELQVIGDPYELALGYYELGLVRRARRELGEASQYLKMSIDIFSKLGVKTESQWSPLTRAQVDNMLVEAGEALGGIQADINGYRQ